MPQLSAAAFSERTGKKHGADNECKPSDDVDQIERTEQRQGKEHKDKPCR